MTQTICGVPAWEMRDRIPEDKMLLRERAQKYYVGIMGKVLPPGTWIILDSPATYMIGRRWNRDAMILGMYDGFWTMGTYLLHYDSGCVIRISGELEGRQWFRPVDSTKLRGRAERNYRNNVKNLVLAS